MLLLTLRETWRRTWATNEAGQSLAEYAPLLVLIAVVAIAVVTGLGQTVAPMLSSVTGAL